VQDPRETMRKINEGVAQPVVGKALLREYEFLDRRGLSREPGAFVLDASSPSDGADVPGETADRRMAGTSRSGLIEGNTVGVSTYLAGTHERDARLVAARPAAAPAPAWTSLGPFGIRNGQTYGGRKTTVAGRVTAIAVDPGNPRHILVGSAAGGVWQTRDGGQSWQPQTDDAPTLSIGALAFNPAEPSTVYAGTGEGNSAYRTLGLGLLVSEDGGDTWKALPDRRFFGVGFYRLLVDPRRPERLIAATTVGAVTSADQGTTWRQLHGLRTWDVSLAYRGDELEVLLAAPDGLFLASGDAVFSPEGHAPPRRIGLDPFFDPEQQQADLLDLATSRMAVAHVPSDPQQAFAFAAAAGSRFLWRRTGASEEFVQVPLAMNPTRALLSVTQAPYDWYVAVPPGSSDTVYLGAIELVKGERTGDGWTFTDISSREQGDSIHPDQHTLAFDPGNPDTIYAGNDGGIFRSPDAGRTWQSLNNGLAISEVEYLAQRADKPDWILAGLQDNGTVRRQSAQDWEQVDLGDGGDCATDQMRPDVCYHTVYHISVLRSDKGGDPESWESVTPPHSRERFAQLFYPPLEVNGNVVVTAGEVVCISSDRGLSWTNVPLPAVDGQPSTASALAVPTQDRVFVGTVLGDVFRIDRGGWGGPAELARPRAGTISDLLVDPRPAGRYWVTYSTAPGWVLRSDDQGATWRDVSNGLPARPVNAIVDDPSDPDRLWVASDAGVYETRDAGANWAVYGTGLPHVLAVDLLFHESSRRLRVATKSRGVWEVTVPA
jgi:photosystem II stability/assembly factor-like uncharacterized protein